jgi:hypothetical protein
LAAIGRLLDEPIELLLVARTLAGVAAVEQALPHADHDLGAVVARLDHGHLHAERREFLRQYLGERLDRVLAHRVGAAHRPVDDARDRAGGCDATLALDQQRRERLGHATGAEHVDLELVAQVVLAQFDQWREHRDAGVVDQRVERAARSAHGLHRGVDLVLLRDVEPDALDVGDGVECLEVRVLARAGPDEEPVRREQFGGLATDARTRARDEDRALRGPRRGLLLREHGGAGGEHEGDETEAGE